MHAHSTACSSSVWRTSIYFSPNSCSGKPDAVLFNALQSEGGLFRALFFKSAHLQPYWSVFSSTGFADGCCGGLETLFCQTLRGHREEVLFWSRVTYQVSKAQTLDYNKDSWSCIPSSNLVVWMCIVGAVCYRRSQRNSGRPGSRRFKPASPQRTERVQTSITLRFVQSTCLITITKHEHWLDQLKKLN